jgi:hypothetical protein
MKGFARKAVLGTALAGLAMVPAWSLRADDSSDDQMEDLRSTLGILTQQFNELKKWSDEMPKPEINVDMRYDYQRYNKVTVNGSTVGPKTSGFVPGAAGMYAKRTELKFKAPVPSMSWMTYELQYDFSGMKLEDLGVTLTNLSFWPMVETPGWSWELKAGQYRQPFGIEPQTSSSATYFPERSMLNGGANPFGFSKLVKERVMGLHFKHKKDLGLFGYNLAVTVANDTENSAGLDLTPTTSSLGGWGAVPTGKTGQFVDQDPSEFGRFGLETSMPLSSMLPFGTKVAVGASALHNSENTAVWASSGAAEAWSDVYGLDLAIDTFQIGSGTNMAPALKLQAEWAGKNNFKATTGLTNRAEAWYALFDLEPWRFLDVNAPKVELLGRYESVMASVDTPTAYPSDQAVSLGLRYQFVGKNYTSINYTTYAVGGDFTAMGGTEFWQVQQQFNY